jgi:hypothetical protein
LLNTERPFNNGLSFLGLLLIFEDEIFWVLDMVISFFYFLQSEAGNGTVV